ncbi:MAG: hypothetical protein ACFFBC_00185 [Promethearchaeota archaeon]
MGEQTFGLTALIFGVLSIPAGIISAFNNYIAWIIPPIAIIFGIIGLKKDELKGRALAGLVLGSVGVIIGLYLLFVK